LVPHRRLPAEAPATPGEFSRTKKPADLPMQQPSKVELVINVKTAKKLDLTALQSILTRADEFIE
jgi:putative tryptophan/tyrosine transport system substrate-binding protein